VAVEGSTIYRFSTPMRNSIDKRFHSCIFARNSLSSEQRAMHQKIVQTDVTNKTFFGEYSTGHCLAQAKKLSGCRDSGQRMFSSPESSLCTWQLCSRLCYIEAVRHCLYLCYLPR
jgi:hypothetical protein